MTVAGAASAAASGVRGERVVTAPNLLAVSRIGLGGAFWAVVDRPPMAFAVMATAAATDVLDGWLARRMGLARPGGTGDWLDPLCDKLFMASVLAAVYAARQPPLPLVALIAARELVQVPAAAAYTLLPGFRRQVPFDFRAGKPGKLATCAQFAAVAAMYLKLPGVTALAGIAGATGLFAAGAYFVRALRKARRS
jgi:phosphatidylglycerophosphate synthase